MNLQVDTGLRAENRFSSAGERHQFSAISLITCILIPLAGPKGAVARGTDFGRIHSGPPSDRNLADRWELGLERASSSREDRIPLLISGTLVSLMMVSDRTVVAIMLSHRDLQAKSHSRRPIIVNSMTLIPFHCRRALPEDCAGLRRTPVTSAAAPVRLDQVFWYNATMLIPISALAYFLIGPIVENYFPKYAPGLPAAPPGLHHLRILGLYGGRVSNPA